VFPLIYKHVNDSVPNIRFTVIKMLSDLSKKFDSPNVRAEMKQNINQVINDPDRDVRSIAQEVLPQL
jgi:serine/threonine-protein phosphatase 2A regulatory subunit A